MKILLKIYACFFYMTVVNNTALLLNKDSLVGTYYHTTIVFSNWFIIPYFLNILSALIDCIICLFLFGYSFEIQGLSRIPAWLFFVRILIECSGNSYELMVIESGFSQGMLVGLIRLLTFFLPILPSFLIQWRMTFKNASRIHTITN